jgi:hypothetical protein
MRITIDADTNSKISLLWKIFKGLLLCHRLPDEIKTTSRGYHMIWYGLKIDFNKHFLYRRFIGDDENRIRLDMNPKRTGQVLFTSKDVFIRKDKKWERMKYCRICHLPLTKFWVYKYDTYYCINCGSKKNVLLYERLVQRRNQLFNSLLLKVKIGVKCQN